MKLNVDTLGTFYEMARQGAGLAADRLTRLSEVESRVTATRIEFSTPAAVKAELADNAGLAGTMVELTSGIKGRTILLFEEESARAIGETLVADLADGVAPQSDDELVESAIPELCSIMNNGFVDGWANVLDREVNMSTPRYVSGGSARKLIDAGEAGDLALLFRSHIETRNRRVGFKHYFVPTEQSASGLFSSEEGIDYENLVGFDRVAQRGADRVTDDLSRLTGFETSIDVRRVSFISLDAIPESVPNETVASVAFSFSGTPSGYLLFLFDENSARTLVETMMGSTPEEGVGAMGRDAVKEASNIMASGLLDGWANVLETSIEHSTPAFTWEMGPAAVDPLIVGLSREQEFAFIFNTEIEAATEAFDADIYVIPAEGDLERALGAIDTDRVEEVAPSADVDVTDLDESELDDVDEVEGVSLE